jgi:tungstate transport system permease protein
MIASLLMHSPDLVSGLRKAVHLIVTGDPAVVYTTKRTLLLAIKATGIATVIALPLGCALGAGRFPGRAVLLAIGNSLTRVPPVVIGVLVLLLVFPRSPFGGGPLASLGWYNSLGGIVFAQTLLAIPVLIALTATAVQRVPIDLLDQARAYGASRSKLGLLALREARGAVLAAIIVALGLTISTIGAIVASGAQQYVEAPPPCRVDCNAAVTLAVGTLFNWRVSSGGVNGQDTEPLAIAYAVILIGLFFVMAAGLTFLQQRRASWVAGAQT